MDSIKLITEVNKLICFILFWFFRESSGINPAIKLTIIGINNKDINIYENNLDYLR